ncbi:Transcobalamin-1 [Acropora cervicornis]|uniref:Transcobalamin-1 n=1 Tax=Acropora cervicornis TaxID=6130 RepID=A0AAD9R7Q2_ACRCE|nr:Transcobalamin-1 [Acropora cervicornis]
MKCSLVTIWIILTLFSQTQGFCGSRLLQTNLTRAAFRAADWLRNKQDKNGTYGEGHASAVAFHSLRLIGDHLEQGAEHLNAEIIKNNLGSISGGRVAHYILGAMSTCRDPKNFYNFNLIRALQTKLGKYPQEAEFSHPFQFSLAVLALCSSGVDFEKRMTFVEDITGSVLQDQSVVYDTDTSAMQVLALTCVRESLKRQRSKPMKIENLNINQAINKASKELLGRQMKDSTFGENEVTAALSAQMIGVRVELLFNHSDSSKKSNLSENTSPKGVSTKGCPPSAYVQVENGTNAHDILKEAANQHSCYNFTAISTAFGHMIKSISGVASNTVENLYWFIYIDGKLAQVGIDDLRPKHGSILRFQYKKVNWG